MSNDTTLHLNDDEERRFDELFSDRGHLELTADWEPTLRAAIRAADSTEDDKTDDGSTDATSEVDVLDLSERRLANRQARRSWRPRLLAAACLALVVGVAAVAFTRSGLPGDEVAEVEVLWPDRQIAPPRVRDLELPADTVQLVATPDGLAAIREIGGETHIEVRVDDGWQRRASLPVVDAQVAIDGDRWVAAGIDATSRVERPGVEGTFLATAITVAISDDAGVSWRSEVVTPAPIAVRDTIGLDEFPTGSETIIREFTLATHDDTVAVLYDHAVFVDLTAMMRDAGVIGAEDRVIFVQDGEFGVAPFVVGPDRIGPIDVEPSDVGTTRAGWNELLAEVTGSRYGLEIDTGDGFTTVDLPGPMGGDPFGLGAWSAAMLAADDLGFIVSDFLARDTYRSTDGRTWTETDLDPAASELGGVWDISSDDRGDLVQSIDGGPFRPIPVPTETTSVAAFTPTEFGGAVVWQDVPSIVRGFLDAEVRQNGWTITESVAGGRTFTSPDGESFAPGNGVGEFDGGWVVTDIGGTVQIFTDDGERVVLAEFDDFRVDVDGLRPSEQFIGWSTDGADWRFAEIEALEPGLWSYEATTDGLVGVERTRTEQAVIIEWPDAFTN